MQWQEYALEIDDILYIFPSGTQSVGDRGSKKAYTGPRTGLYLLTKFGCDRSIVVGCRSRNGRQTGRQTEWSDNKAHSLRCERDAISSQNLINYVTYRSITDSGQVGCKSIFNSLVRHLRDKVQNTETKTLGLITICLY